MSNTTTTQPIIPVYSIKTKDVRCTKCNHLLGKFESVDGEIKCHKCKELNKVKV